MENKFLVVGIPRSGYALTNTIVKKILEFNSVDRNLDPAYLFIHRIEPILSNYLHQSYLKVFEKHKLKDRLLLNGEFDRIMGGPQWLVERGNYFGVRKYFGIKDVGDILLTHNFSGFLFNYYTHHHSHENPKAWVNNVEFIDYIKLTTLRNPAGILNSSAHSLNALTSEYIQKYCATSNESEVREIVAKNKLSDLNVVDGLINFQLSYFNDLLPVIDKYHKIKWEDVITDPIKTILYVAEKMKVKITSSTAKNIWNSMDHRNTFIHHKHNFRQGKGLVGNWKDCLVNEHIDILKSKGFDDICKSIDYPLFEYFDEKNYTPFQVNISRNVKSGIVPAIEDANLRTFSFNKSNIDDSGFGFKKFLGEDASITRFACPDEYNQLAVDLLDEAEMATCKINEIFNGLSFDDGESSAFELCKNKLESLSVNAKGKKIFSAAIRLNKDMYLSISSFIKKKIQTGNKIGIWGISKDFDTLIYYCPELIGLLSCENIFLFDQLEAGNVRWGQRVKSSNELKKFFGTIILMPSAWSPRKNMHDFAEKNEFVDRVVDLYEV